MIIWIRVGGKVGHLGAERRRLGDDLNATCVTLLMLMRLLLRVGGRRRRREGGRGRGEGVRATGLRQRLVKHLRVLLLLESSARLRDCRILLLLRLGRSGKERAGQVCEPLLTLCCLTERGGSACGRLASVLIFEFLALIYGMVLLLAIPTDSAFRVGKVLAARTAVSASSALGIRAKGISLGLEDIGLKRRGGGGSRSPASRRARSRGFIGRMFIIRVFMDIVPEEVNILHSLAHELHCIVTDILVVEAVDEEVFGKFTDEKRV